MINTNYVYFCISIKFNFMPNWEMIIEIIWCVCVFFLNCRFQMQNVNSEC